MSKRIKDITGQKFNRLEAISFVEVRKPFGALWLFRCECGVEKTLPANRVKGGNTTSCGCYRRDCACAQKGKPTGRIMRIDMTGRVFPCFTVVRFDRHDSDRKTLWRCKCSCGSEFTARRDDLLRRKRTDCGCRISKPKKLDTLSWLVGSTFGDFTVVRAGDTLRAACKCGSRGSFSEQDLRDPSKTWCWHPRNPANKGAYSSFQSMWKRCTDPENGRYCGKVTVCARWRSFKNFLEDMGPRPAVHSFDRIDGTGNYEPTNCRWLTPKGQARNIRTNRLITVDGQKITIGETAERMGVSYALFHHRLKKAGFDGQAVVDQLRDEQSLNDLTEPLAA